ncbi:MAG TPA: radical SAM protein [Terriglobales bacterium]|nr:radical SAM protein [Terriglobales bacterium]
MLTAFPDKDTLPWIRDIMANKRRINQMSSLPLIPDSGTRLIGIARLAAHGETVRQGHEVEYFTLPVRSLLNRCVSKRQMPFSWTINPYRGCEFACKYCYARYTHEFMEMRNGLEFEQKIYVKQHAAELLQQELRRVKPNESIAIGTATDPYQPIERKLEITRAILEQFAGHSGFEIGIVSKSAMIVRDIDVLQEISRRNHLTVNFTVTTTETELARILEPRAPRPDLRLEALRQLREAGIRAGVICAPVLPGITDSPKQLESVVRAAAEARANYIYANPLFLKPCSAAIFLPFLKEHFPKLVPDYEQRFKDRAFLPRTYRKRISDLFAQLRKKYHIEKESRWEWPKPEPQNAQLSLFAG